MIPDDLDAVMQIERKSFADPWTRRMYLTDLTQNDLATYLVLRPPLVLHANGSLPFPSLMAFGGFWLMADEAHIATIASHPDWRGCGLGEWLLLLLLERAIARGAVTSTLEVRAGNFVARRLYAKMGYEVAGSRRHYYRDGEDGLIMTTPPLHDPFEQSLLAAARADAMARLRRCLSLPGMQ
jgi:[ribosomal protein S18]-alanine N-acetyltransferase